MYYITRDRVESFTSPESDIAGSSRQKQGRLALARRRRSQAHGQGNAKGRPRDIPTYDFHGDMVILMVMDMVQMGLIELTTESQHV